MFCLVEEEEQPFWSQQDMFFGVTETFGIFQMGSRTW